MKRSLNGGESSPPKKQKHVKPVNWPKLFRIIQALSLHDKGYIINDAFILKDEQKLQLMIHLLVTFF